MGPRVGARGDGDGEGGRGEGGGGSEGKNRIGKHRLREGAWNLLVIRKMRLDSGVSGWVTHRSSSFVSSSVMLSSMRKISCSSREKERAIVLARQRLAHLVHARTHGTRVNREEQGFLRLRATAIRLPLAIKGIVLNADVPHLVGGLGSGGRRCGGHSC